MVSDQADDQGYCSRLTCSNCSECQFLAWCRCYQAGDTASHSTVHHSNSSAAAVCSLLSLSTTPCSNTSTPSATSSPAQDDKKDCCCAQRQHPQTALKSDDPNCSYVSTTVPILPGSLSSSSSLSLPFTHPARNRRKGRFTCAHSCCSSIDRIFNDRSNWLKHMNRIRHPKCNDLCAIHSWRRQYYAAKKSSSANHVPKHLRKNTESRTRQPLSSSIKNRHEVIKPHLSTYLHFNIALSSPASAPYAIPSSQPAIAHPPSSFLWPHRVSMLGPMSDACAYDDMIHNCFLEHGHVIFTPFITQDPLFSSTPIIDLPSLTSIGGDVFSCPFKIVNLSTRSVPISKRFEDYYVGKLPLCEMEALEALKHGDLIGFDQQHGPLPIYLSHGVESRHPLCFGSCINHSLSLLSLLDSKHDDFDRVRCSHKQFIDHFNAHYQPLGGPSIHHILKGKVRWYLVPARHLDRLKIALIKLIKTHLPMSPLDPELDELLLVLFAANQIFPLPDFLRQEGVDVYAFDLCAGELLYVAGDWVHFGFNQAPHSVSLTTNLLSEAWLKSGPVFVREHLRWLQRVRDRMSAAVQSHPNFERVFNRHNLHDCFSVCPHRWACHLFSRLRNDIECFLHNGTSRFKYQLPVGVLESSLDNIKIVILLLHDLRKFYSQYHESVCECPL